ncbi:ATPase, T2SS/T4P/T4SS family [Psychrobacter sp.]|uniref:ATPase, T2SS/T4P/T4SS family n=1 Tax=Psychrobacter sp. TaxID=56811 RepID=UPI0025D899CF|nr:ATPase, T2SS/T4P/T4SS family [Psychrobacter sp.]
MPDSKSSLHRPSLGPTLRSNTSTASPAHFTTANTHVEKTSIKAVNLSTIDNDPVVKLVNSLLIEAVRLGASDLHFEPYEQFYRVRFRIDGVLKQMSTLSTELIAKVSARLKIMARMDIAERRLPQDGRIKLITSDNRALDYRASALPTLFGEKIVLRVIDDADSLTPIDQLGLEPDQQLAFISALRQPQGIVLITGPTGSGKTLSLYSGLNLLNTEAANISTVEDPIEINLSGINQVNVNLKIGLNFDVALKSFLRQDPDVVMIGEIRDLETADTAIRAAQTGHLVLSTLHTNSAAETLARLHHMGIALFNIATAISLVVAQRLARRLCDYCKKPTYLPSTSLQQMGFLDSDLKQLQLPDPDYQLTTATVQSTIYKAIGCELCIDGYKGRVGIFEVMPISDSLAELIMHGGHALQLKALAQQQGFYDLKRAAILKVMQGIISIDEMNRVVVA